MEWDKASLFAWYAEQMPHWEVLPRTPKYSPSHFFLWQTDTTPDVDSQMPVVGKDHSHRHASSITANTAQSAEAAFATGLTDGST